ncbi:MAG TPA: hypothetical protein ENH82_19355, partial [bacterium]|nr:hypothetical protein [bacterium]
MKHLLIILCTCTMGAFFSQAADFSPSLLTLENPEAIYYNFDGSELTIPFTVSGTPAAVWLVINTHGKSNDISAVRNGHLGWHYVNNIDTTIYVSPRYEREQGKTSIIWDGKDQDGNLVLRDDYSYYLWAYDYHTPKQLASNFVQIAHGWDAQYCDIIDIGEDGLIIPEPFIMGSEAFWSLKTGPGGGTDNLYIDVPYGTHFKWTLGSDPMDFQYYLRTLTPGYHTNNNKEPIDFVYGGPVLNPYYYNEFYHWSGNFQTHSG